MRLRDTQHMALHPMNNDEFNSKNRSLHLMLPEVHL